MAVESVRRGQKYVLRSPKHVPIYILIVRVGRDGTWVDIEARNSSGRMLRKRVEMPLEPGCVREEWTEESIQAGRTAAGVVQ